MRHTAATIQVLNALLDGQRHYGYEILLESGLRGGTVYPILRRLEDEGWVKGSSERIRPSDRPPRRYYKLTALGARKAALAVSAQRS